MKPFPTLLLQDFVLYLETTQLDKSWLMVWQIIKTKRSFNLIKGRFPAPWGVRSAKKWLFHTPSACGGVVDLLRTFFGMVP